MCVCYSAVATVELNLTEGFRVVIYVEKSGVMERRPWQFSCGESLIKVTGESLSQPLQSQT